MGPGGAAVVMTNEQLKWIGEVVNRRSADDQWAAGIRYSAYETDLSRYIKETPAPEVDWFELNRSFAQGDE